jgi:phenylpropionate dioxygenase-like ring-hydroxylating dioxygenase large terminal subunit
VNSGIENMNAGAARCPRAPSTQSIVHRDKRAVPAVLEIESPKFLGDEDVSFDRYYSQEFFDAEMAKIWSKVWQWACREEHIPEAGDYVTYQIGHHSILIVRTANRAIKAYHNSCLHRGTKLRPADSEGNAGEFTCPFHGWTWSIDGALKFVPSRWDLPHVTAERYQLPAVKVDTWGGLVFVNLDLDAPPLERFMGVMPEHFKEWDIANRYVEVHVKKELYANWKMAMEAFMENYHTQTAHPQLCFGNGDEMTQYDIFGDHVSRFFATNGVSSPHLDKSLTEQELVDQMLVGDRSVLADGTLEIGENESARIVMARVLRSMMGRRYRCDLTRFTDTEMIDVHEYTLFPNMILFPGISIPMVYRFRPIGNDPTRTLFELLMLRPIPDDGPRPQPADPVTLKEEESFTTVSGLDPGFGRVFDQDTGILRSQQEGVMAAKKAGQTLTNYQEVRIRHFENTVDKYLRGYDISP